MAANFAQFGPPAPPGPKVAAVPDSLRNALVSYWKLDGPGANGDWPDSVGGNPLVDHGSVSTVQGIFGDSSRAALFNSASKRLVAADNISLRLAYPFTFFLAVTILELPADGVDAWILHKEEEYGLKLVRSGNECRFAIVVWTDDPPTVTPIDQTLVAGQTYVLAFGLNGAQAGFNALGIGGQPLEFNGMALNNALPTIGAGAGGEGDLTIGAYSDGTLPFTGIVDELALYNVAFEQSDFEDVVLAGGVSLPVAGCFSGLGSPQGVVVAAPGSNYWDGVNKQDWRKDTGVGNTGWIQKDA